MCILVFLELATILITTGGCVAVFYGHSIVCRGTVARRYGMFAKTDLEFFFPVDGQSLARGVTIHCQHGLQIVSGVFVGFLADEKAHKEVSSCSGASGRKPCIACANVCARMSSDAIEDVGLLTLKCVDPSKFVTHTDQSIFEITDALRDAATTSPNALGALQTNLGMRYVPEGIAFDRDLRARGIYKPLSNMVRDWMHVLLNNGVANSQLFELVDALGKHCGIQVSAIQDYMCAYTLPFKRGKVARAWLGPKRIKKKKSENDLIIRWCIAYDVTACACVSARCR